MRHVAKGSPTKRGSFFSPAYGWDEWLWLGGGLSGCMELWQRPCLLPAAHGQESLLCSSNQVRVPKCLLTGLTNSFVIVSWSIAVTCNLQETRYLLLEQQAAWHYQCLLAWPGC